MRKKAQISSQVQSLVNNLSNSIRPNNMNDACIKYALYHCVEIRDFVVNITENEEISKIVNEKFPEVFGTSISPDFTNRNAVDSVFRIFLNKYNCIMNAIKSGCTSKFCREVENCIAVLECSQFFQNLTQQQEENQQYIELRKICDNYQKMKEDIPFYGRFKIFVNYCNRLKQYCQLYKNGTLSEYDAFQLRPIIQECGPIFSERFYDLEYVQEDQKNNVSLIGPFVAEVYPKIDEIVHEASAKESAKNFMNNYFQCFICFYDHIRFKSFNSLLQDFISYESKHYELSHQPLFAEAAKYEPFATMANQINALVSLVNDNNAMFNLRFDEIMYDKGKNLFDTVCKWNKFDSGKFNEFFQNL